MDAKDLDTQADISSVSDRGETLGLMEPLLIGSGSRHRGALTDVAIELAAQSAGFRRSLPEGVLTALADLVRAMNCYQRSRARYPADIVSAPHTIAAT
jgi:hypothetical protein